MKTLLTTSLAAILIGSSATAATVAHYQFEGSGSAAVGSTISDSVGGHHGTVEGGALQYGSDPVVGSYLRFDADGPSVGGLGNRVVVPGSSAFVFSTNEAFTIETIFRTTQTLTNGVMVSKGADVSNPDSQWWLRHRGDGRVQGLFEGVDNTVEDSATSTTGLRFDDGLWHHLGVVFDGTGATARIDLYVDGVLRGSDIAIGTLGIIGGTDADPIIFGEFATLVANRSFSGDLAEVRLSNGALVPAEFLVVPEPTTISLLLLGLAGLWIRRK